MSQTNVAAAPRGTRQLQRAFVMALVAGGSIGALAMAGPATADGSRCSANERVLVTWGAADPDNYDTIATGQPGSRHHDVSRLELVTQIDQRFRQGPVAKLRQLEVRTVRDRNGVGHPELCGSGHRVVRLPTVGRTSLVGGASVNGSTLTWRLWRKGKTGRIYRATITDSGLVRRAQISTAKAPRAQAVDGRIVATSEGLVAFATGDPGTKGSTSRATVWPTGQPPRTTMFPDDEYGQSGRLTSVRPVDAAHVLTNVSDVPITAGPTRPGRCPTPIVGTWQPLADRQALSVLDTTTVEESSSDRVTTSDSWVLVCDPADGTLETVSSERESGNKYDNTSSRVTRLMRNGPWTLVEHGITDPRTDITDSRQDATVTVPGLIAVTGEPATPVPVGAAPPSTVAVIPGAIASTSPTRSKSSPVVLRDATGRRVVGQGYGTKAMTQPALTLTPTTLTWTTTGPTQTTTVTPLPGATITSIPRP